MLLQIILISDFRIVVAVDVLLDEVKKCLLTFFLTLKANVELLDLLVEHIAEFSQLTIAHVSLFTVTNIIGRYSFSFFILFHFFTINIGPPLS